MVRLAAVETYIDEVAERIDAGEKDLEVEGSIAKWFATEAGNRAAEDCIQALGGYGYIAEYGVEKIKRDVRITTIYEGTSEIQQNIISTFRWKKSRKSKGGFYGEMAAEMDRLEKNCPGCGGRYYALAARALNHLIKVADTRRLTRLQIVMFDLADLMAHVEVGVAAARKAQALAAAGDPGAERATLVARIFARHVCELFERNSLRILAGTGEIDEAAVAVSVAEIRIGEFAGSCRNHIRDMDRLAELVFGRRT